MPNDERLDNIQKSIKIELGRRMNAQNLAKKKPQKAVVPDFYQFPEKSYLFFGILKNV